MSFKENYFFNSTIMASFLPVNSEQEELTNREKYVFYCSVSQIHINPEKKTKNPIIMTVGMYLLGVASGSVLN